MKQQFLNDKTGILSLIVYEMNRPVIASSATATITLYYPSGSVLQAETAVTAIDATTGEITYALTTTHTADADLNYKADWKYIVNGVTYYKSQLFDIVKSILYIPISDDDLYSELNSLLKANKQDKGTASTSGTSSTLIDTKRKESDNYWKGGVLEIIAGTGVGQIRDITSFTQSTGTIAVTPNFVTNPDTTSVYRIVKSFTAQIQQSFEKLEDMLYSQGKRQDLILESSQIKFPLIYLTIHFICLDLMDEPDDKWKTLADIYWTKFQDSYNALRIEYDEDESGFIQGENEESQNAAELNIYRS